MRSVTSGVSDAQEYRLILGQGFVERLFSPGIPIYRLIGVLEQVRGFFRF